MYPSALVCFMRGMQWENFTLANNREGGRVYYRPSDMAVEYGIWEEIECKKILMFKSEGRYP